MQKYVSHMEQNNRYSRFDRMRNPTLLSLSLVQRQNGDFEQKAFCVLQFVKHESFVSVQRTFQRQFQSDPPSANSILRWYLQFQTRDTFIKGKVQDVCVCQKKVWKE
jgi:hypothetical protein